MIRLILLIASGLIVGCSSEDVNETIVLGGTVYTPRFEKTLLTIEESQSVEVFVVFNCKVEDNGFIELELSGDAVLNEDYSINLTIDENSRFSMPVVEGDSVLNFSVTAIIDNDSDEEQVKFNFTDASDFIQLDRNNELRINISDPPTDTDTEETLTVVTWNVKKFPLVGSTTVNSVADIINNMDADVIAFQEIDDIASFEQLDVLLTEWEGALYNVRGAIELSYLYKTSEITSASNLSVIYNDDSDTFPRQPVLTTVTHVSGLEVTLINIHLKCCGTTGSEDANRREAASINLEEYINNNLPTQNVIVLGDWNDDISDGPFDNFLSNSENYLFADFEIGEGSNSNWSYPSWPSHLDHILITNELFDNLVNSETLLLDQTVSNYFENISDHRPVSATFSNN
ncbi:endonuclease/exonuclease/phosphatase family protein [Fulvivirga lutea]|uniref:Endonuclease/exonuclease/phosphatase family protein n=1 Tax=Fulvivirga lutea TaxID=2810512 RepID=A0A974ZZL1_9BACT|nr:endonuclease/exonuclease/phosphatase family protein [Fulvivirga lutea]QSE96354.1 endonuclease/exonuclease/phosphatase family protein [Fulvivirga lutea]